VRSALATLLLACSPATDAVDEGLVDGRAPHSDAGLDVAAFPYPLEDAHAEAEAAPPFAGGGPFACGNCMCDGTLDYCAWPLAADAGEDAGACALDAGLCRPIPIACLPKPSCDCLVPEGGACACGVDPSGEGLVVVCDSYHHGGPT